MTVVAEYSEPSPSHPSSHAIRSGRQYQYFPSVCVYHDADRGLYFFPRGREWRIAVSLPSELRTELGDYVTFILDSDKPYSLNDLHKQQYPPGKAKNQ